MRLELKQVPFLDIQKHFVDFQKKSRCFEMPPDHAEFYGAYLDNTLIGYLIAAGYENNTVEINQGYLIKEARFLRLGPQYLKLLEDTCKRAGFKEIIFKASRSLRSYIRYANKAGYKPKSIVFTKNLGV